MFLRFQFISGHCCQNTKRKLSALQGNLSQTTQTGLDPNHYAVIKCVLWSFSLTNCEHDEHCLTPNVVCFLTFCQDSDLSILKHTVHVRNSPYSNAASILSLATVGPTSALCSMRTHPNSTQLGFRGIFKKCLSEVTDSFTSVRICIFVKG